MFDFLFENTERLDAQKVEEAIGYLLKEDIENAINLLTEVISNTPEQYVNQYEIDGMLFIKFWDLYQFIHFVTWQSRVTEKQSVHWIPNAYPRAYYYLGYIYNHNKQYEQAIKFLDAGRHLEPGNPKFTLAKARAYLGLGDYKVALSLYNQIDEVGPYVTGMDKALALRGKGFILIEMGQLDAAEVVFKESLKYDPDSKIALNELAYIEELRQGILPGMEDTSSPMVKEATTSLSPKVKCKVCGKTSDGMSVFNTGSQIIYICEQCQKQL